MHAVHATRSKHTSDSGIPDSGGGGRSFAFDSGTHSMEPRRQGGRTPRRRQSSRTTDSHSPVLGSLQFGDDLLCALSTEGHACLDAAFKSTLAAVRDMGPVTPAMLEPVMGDGDVGGRGQRSDDRRNALLLLQLLLQSYPRETGLSVDGLLAVPMTGLTGAARCTFVACPMVLRTVLQPWLYFDPTAVLRTSSRPMCDLSAYTQTSVFHVTSSAASCSVIVLYPSTQDNAGHPLCSESPYNGRGTTSSRVDG